MVSNRLRQTIAIFAGAGFLVAVAWADLSSKSESLVARAGEELIVPLQLQPSAGITVDGINGQINYNSALFSNPNVLVGPTWYHAFSNEISPGKVRFVVYADSPHHLNNLTPSIFLSLKSAASLPHTGTTLITYSNGPLANNDPDKAAQTAASSPSGVSLDNVSFASVQVSLSTSAAAGWLRFK